MSRKVLLILLMFVLAFGLMPAMESKAESISPTFSDMPDDWSTEAMEYAVEQGWFVGDNGKIMSDGFLTRAQMASVIVRAFNLTEEGDLSGYSDVKETDWFYSSLAKVYKMGVMQGYAGLMMPNDYVTREQAFVVFARALNLESATTLTKSFEDSGEISDWARGEVYALVNAGYLQGSGDGKLNPQANIKRNEFAQLMFNLKELILDYLEDAATVSVTGVTLNKIELSLLTGGTETLTAVVAPAKATNKNITWASDNTGIATVDANGLVTAVGAGEATITVTTVDGSFTDECTVTITSPEFAGGDGTSEDPYQVATAAQLDNVRNHLDKHFIQIADIDLTDYFDFDAPGYNAGSAWDPIGYSANPFTGTYDGNEKTISGLTIARSNEKYVGLFGKSTGSIIDVSLLEVDVDGYEYVGGLIGENNGIVSDSDVSGSVNGVYNAIGGLIGVQVGSRNVVNCSSSGTVSISNDNTYYYSVGGLIGYLSQGQVSDSYSSSDVIGGRDYTGGLIGYSWYSTIDNCFATGDVTGTYMVGGLIGDNNSMSEITNCYATGTVTASGYYVGGLIGRNYSQIMNCYSTGLVTGEAYDKGGLVGRNEGGTYINSYYDTNTSGQSDTGKGIPKTTLEMKQQATFEGWNFDTIWGINIDENGGYPFLK